MCFSPTTIKFVMKKTPADFAQHPVLQTLNAVTAIVAIAGAIGSAPATANAQDDSPYKFDTKSQSSNIQDIEGRWTNTSGRISTSSRGGFGIITTDDSDSYTDNDNSY